MKRRLFSSILAAAFFLGVIEGFAGEPTAPIKVACIGDSITYGATIMDRNTNSYPAQLAAALGDKWSVVNFGVNAATLLKKGNKPYWNLGQYRSALELNPDVVVIKLGTNDSKPGNWAHKAEFVSNYVELIESFQKLQSKPTVWICYPVPAYPGNWGITDKVMKEEAMPLIDEIAKQAGVKIIDLHSALSDRKELFPDKVHPNAEGAKLMAHTIAAAITGKTTGQAEQESVEPSWPGTKSAFHSFDQYNFTIDDMRCRVVVPNEVAADKPWIWRARFFGHEPQTDIALLNKGFHVAYVDVGGLFGSPSAVARWDAFYKYLTESHGFAKKAALEGMSRGGLIIFNWAAKNPDKVHCIYADAPVCDFKSWPGPNSWGNCIKAYGLTEEEALAYKKNPIDNLGPLAGAKIPLLHVVGAVDKVVPVAENTAIIERRYKELGGEITVISKPDVGHHPHSLKDPTPIVEFILNTSQ